MGPGRRSRAPSNAPSLPAQSSSGQPPRLPSASSVAPAPLAPLYHTIDSGTCATPVEDAQECENAAAALGRVYYRNQSRGTNWPQGCFVRFPNGMVYYNTGAGACQERFNCVCARP